MLEACKTALRLTTDAYDAQIEQLIESAKLDLGIAGVEIPCPAIPDAVVKTAIITYVKLHFGDLDANIFDKLKASYDEQKAALSMATGYTDWGDLT